MLRLASSVVLAPLVLLCVAYGGWPVAVLLAAALAGCLLEWRGLAVASRQKLPPLPLAGGSAFLTVSMVSLLWLRWHVSGAANVFFLLAIVWTTDSAAYAVGRLVGGPRLAPSISPGKTRSGALGGLAGAVIVAEICAACWHGDFLKAGLVAALLSVVSQTGDLAESWCKRRAGQKDSGSLIPGHGGLLDRLDGLLAVAPVAALIVAIGGQVKGLWWS